MSSPVRQRPVPDAVTAFHWAAAAEGRLEVQRCSACGTWQYPPSVGCPACIDGTIEPVAVSGRGTVYSFTVVRQAFDPGFVDQLPYVVALVALEEDPAIRLLTNLVEVEPDAIDVDMAVEVVFEPLGDTALPQFRPVTPRGER
jgi:uncharacterized OB-fold protein